MDTPYASTTGNPLPKFEDSEKFVKKYFFENENHEYDKWYMVINDEDEILGNVYINKKNIIAYQIIKKYQKHGFGETSVKLMMKKNPRKVYIAIVNINNESSIEFIKKLEFKEKALIFEKTNDS